MEYKIIHGETIDSLEEAVNAYLAKGWIPQGGIILKMGVFYQAIIKKG